TSPPDRSAFDNVESYLQFGDGTPPPSLVSSATEQSLFILSSGLTAFDNVEYSSTSLLCEERARRRDGRCSGRFSQPGHRPRRCGLGWSDGRRRGLPAERRR